MTEKSSITDFLRRLKEHAKKVSRRGTAKYMQALEEVAREHGFSCFHEIEKLAAAERMKPTFNDVAEILDCPPRSSIVYHAKIGDSAWSLRAERHGPRLHLEYRPVCEMMDESNVSDIGLFQVLQVAGKSDLRNYRRGGQFPSRGWVVTRYGHHRCHTLEFMAEDEVKTLSHHFGIPFHDEIEQRDQQIVSEMRFFKSPAFKHLRSALRTGQQPLPSLSNWAYGLCPLWGHLVALSDTNFTCVTEIVDGYFNSDCGVSKHSGVNERLRELWPQISTLGKTGAGLDHDFIDMVNSWKRRKAG